MRQEENRRYGGGHFVDMAVSLVRDTLAFFFVNLVIFVSLVF